jgi:hypothetical protein
MTRRSLLSTLLFVVALPAFAFAAGGWAITTVETLPEYLVVGVPTEITFTVRQHGESPNSALAPVVEAKSGLTSIIAKATRAARPGEYVAEVSLPRTGDWKLTIMTSAPKPLSFFPSPSMLGRSELLPIQAINAGTPAPAPASPVDRGKALFVAKGCVGCHVHGAVERESFKVGPELTRLGYTADHLSSLLRDPPPPRLGGMRMPNLGLHPDEISALVAFLSPPAKGR